MEVRDNGKPLAEAEWDLGDAAGCTMMLKPSEHTSLTAPDLGVIAEAAGLPTGVLNIVTGLGADVGQALADDPRVDKLAFAGSVPTGARLMAAAAKDVENILVEPGGKSPFVVFADNDVEKAVEWIMFGILWNQGRVCFATSRALVERSQPTFTKALWGGYKQSGIGRELGRWGSDNCLETKQIIKLTSDQPSGWYIKG